jgi:hypothetical protein
MNSKLDKTELSYAEKEFIYNVFSNDKALGVNSLYVKHDIKWLASALFFTGICIAGIISILFL